MVTPNNVNSQSFVATDDLIVPLPEDMSNPPPPPAGGRPFNAAGARPINIDASGTVQPLTYKGDYSWFLTAIPAPNSPNQFTVSVVVVCKRNNTATTAKVSTFYDSGMGGGSVLLSGSFSPLEVKENDWIALCGGGLCYWYRVVAVGDDGLNYTLVGPDWNPATAATAVAVGQSVLGVYTTTVQLDTDPTWKN